MTVTTAWLLSDKLQPSNSRLTVEAAGRTGFMRISLFVLGRDVCLHGDLVSVTEPKGAFELRKSLVFFRQRKQHLGSFSHVVRDTA